MRKSILTGVLFLGLLGMACQKPVQIYVTQTEMKEEGNQAWEVNVQRSVFSSADEGINAGCMAVNERVQSLIDSLKKVLVNDADTFYAKYGETAVEMPAFRYQLFVRDSVFRVDNDYISVRILAYTFEGGAHGMTNFYGYNYDMKGGRFLKDGEILGMGKAGEINGLLVKNFQNPDSCFTDLPSLESGYAALNIGMSALTFTYPQYVLGPYSCGYAQVAVPFTELSGVVSIKGVE